jgi:hypothetical protein
MIASDGLDAVSIDAVEGAGRDGAVELRSVGGELSLVVVEHLLGRPPGLASVCTMSGGTASIRTAFSTRLSPWRAK